MAISLFRRRTPDIEPTEIAVAHQGGAFRVSVRRRPAARRMTLRVSGISGEIVLTLPQRAAFKTAEAFVAGHAGWIAARVARLPEKIDFRPDSVVPLRGVPHRIVHEPLARGATVLRDGPEPAIVVRGEV
jgi:predicted metal-dependent hydrolase